MKSPIYVAMATASGDLSDIAFLDAVDERIHRLGTAVSDLFDDGEVIYAEAVYRGPMGREELEAALAAVLVDFPVRVSCGFGSVPFVRSLIAAAAEPPAVN